MGANRAIPDRNVRWIAIAVSAFLLLQFGGCVYNFYKPIQPVFEDAAFTRAIQTTVREAIGPDYAIEISPGPLERVGVTSGMLGPKAAGWERRTVLVARAIAYPQFAVYMDFIFDNSGFRSVPNPVLTPEEIARDTAWVSAVASIPSARRVDFFAECARSYPYNPAGWQDRQIEGVIDLANPGPQYPYLAPVASAAGRYRVLWGTPDHGSGGSIEVTY